jgi:hypothetical protein
MKQTITLRFLCGRQEEAWRMRGTSLSISILCHEDLKARSQYRLADFYLSASQPELKQNP